ncbi:MAG: hypothetical protein KKD07_03555 [Candidatus Omnitrophica bacterium]|nr:hypothetical protein [Candidatus Omnitrophota bacterium]
MKKTIFRYFIVVFTVFIVLELAFRVHFGVPKPEPDPLDFKFAHVDIHQKFFKKVTEGNKEIYTTQRERSSARSFFAVKSSDTKRIFILGGSVAEAWSSKEPVFSLDIALGKIFPRKSFEIINCAVDGYDSYRAYLVAKEIVAYEPDLIIVASGNNEFYNYNKINLSVYYANKFLRGSLFYRKAQDMIRKKMSFNVVEYGREAEKRFEFYENNIKEIVKLSKKNDIPIILSTLPLNFRETPPAHLRPLDKQFILGCILLENEKYVEAMDSFRGFISREPQEPFGYYYMGRVFDGMKDYQKAKENYLTSLELSSESWNQANPRSNNIIRQVSIKEKVGFADLEKAFMEIADNEIPGNKQFQDYCHIWAEYYSIFNEVVIEEMVNKNILQLNRSDNDKYNSIFSLIQYPSLADRGKFKKNDVDCQIYIGIWEVVGTAWREEDGEFVLKTEYRDRAISYFETLYQMDPSALWGLQFKKELIRTRLLNEYSSSELMARTEMFEKTWPILIYHIGETYRRMKLNNEALEDFDISTALNKEIYLPYVGRALIYYSLGENNKVQENLKIAETLTDSMDVQYYKEILGK